MNILDFDNSPKNRGDATIPAKDPNLSFTFRADKPKKLKKRRPNKAVKFQRKRARLLKLKIFNLLRSHADFYINKRKYAKIVKNFKFKTLGSKVIRGLKENMSCE